MLSFTSVPTSNHSSFFLSERILTPYEKLAEWERVKATKKPCLFSSDVCLSSGSVAGTEELSKFCFHIKDGFLVALALPGRNWSWAPRTLPLSIHVPPSQLEPILKQLPIIPQIFDTAALSVHSNGTLSSILKSPHLSARFSVNTLDKYSTSANIWGAVTGDLHAAVDVSYEPLRAGVKTLKAAISRPTSFGSLLQADKPDEKKLFPCVSRVSKDRKGEWAVVYDFKNNLSFFTRLPPLKIQIHPSLPSIKEMHLSLSCSASHILAGFQTVHPCQWIDSLMCFAKMSSSPNDGCSLALAAARYVKALNGTVEVHCGMHSFSQPRAGIRFRRSCS